jgi:hypothetical protein
MFQVERMKPGSSELSGIEMGLERINSIHDKMTIICLSCILFFAITLGLYSQSSSGGYPESYVLRNVGARPISMGGAYTAIVNEPTAIFYNPAGLGFFTDQPAVSTMYSFLEYGRTHSAIAWGQTIANNFGVGFGVNSYSSGSFIGRDIRGNNIGKFADWAYSIVGAASYKMEFASIGVGLKYLTDNLTGSGTAADGYSMDLGMKFNVKDLFSFGLAMQDITSRMYWNYGEQKTEILPFTLRAGIAMEYGLNEEQYTTRSGDEGEIEKVVIPPTRYILVALDAIMIQRDMSPRFVLGCEAVIHEMIAVRGGIDLYGESLGVPKLLPLNYWGAGISIRPEIKDLPFVLHIDYTISGDKISQSGISHHLALMFFF